jgi:protein involved in polysaccharide export with SLBB domain
MKRIWHTLRDQSLKQYVVVFSIFCLQGNTVFAQTLTPNNLGMSPTGTTVGQSGVGQSGVGQSGVGQSGVGQSGVGQSGVGQSGVGQSGVGQSGSQGRPLPTVQSSPIRPQTPYFATEAERLRWEFERKTAFERYVFSLSGVDLKRFGADLVRDGDQSFVPPSTASVPNDYSMGAGDEIFIRVWGSVDADLRLVVDREGQITIPKVGSVKVGGASYGSLSRIIQNALNQMYSGVNVSASLGQMRGIRVYVTGFAEAPGAYTVNNLSSMVNVVMAAGGPSASGSFRNIQLLRGGKLVSTFDLYDLLLKGDKSADRPVTSEDVIYVGPVGGQVAIFGAINKPAIYELKTKESIHDLLTFAGGFASGAITSNISYMGLATRRDGFKEIKSKQFIIQSLVDGDLFFATNALDIAQPTTTQNRIVTVGGEVNRPGQYVLNPSQTLQDAIMLAGGFTANAYLYGTRLERLSVRQEQIRDIERFKSESRRLINNDSLRKQTTAEDVQLTAGSRARLDAVLAALDEFKPEGRLALGIGIESRELPAILVESGDRITVPPVPNNITVMGSIPSGSVSMTYFPQSTLGTYVERAGGYSRGADQSRAYVMRASGQFASATNRWFTSANSIQIYPGDAIFVPEDLQKSTLSKELKDWAQIFFQIGLGAAAIKVLAQ